MIMNDAATASEASAADDEEVADELVAERRAGDGGESHDRVHRHRGHAACHQTGDGGGCLAVGVGEPRVERREAGLGAVADDDEPDRQAERSRVELVGDDDQTAPSQPCVDVDARVSGDEVHQHGAEQCGRDADRAEHEVLP